MITRVTRVVKIPAEKYIRFLNFIIVAIKMDK